MSILVTGGAGFIGSNFVPDWLAQSDEFVINLYKLIYAGNLDNLQRFNGDHRHVFVQGDIGDSTLVANLLAQYQPCAIVNFAAESHVDRSIHGSEDFVQTNVVGTFRLVDAVRAYWIDLQSDARQAFHFLHVSIDEVYGSLGKENKVLHMALWCSAKLLSSFTKPPLTTRPLTSAVLYGAMRPLPFNGPRVSPPSSRQKTPKVSRLSGRRCLADA